MSEMWELKVLLVRKQWRFKPTEMLLQIKVIKNELMVLTNNNWEIGIKEKQRAQMLEKRI